MASHTKGLSVMSGTNLVFDTCAVINLLNQQYDLPTLGINVDGAKLLTSVIVRMELLSKQNMTDNEELDIREFLDDLVIVPLDDAIEQKAIEKPLKYAAPSLSNCLTALLLLPQLF